MTFDSATPSQGSCSEASGTVTCSLGTIADQADATVEIKVHPTVAGTITNQATVSATTADPVLVNNSTSADDHRDPAADLSLTNTDSPDPVLAGQLLTYTLTAQNAGPSDATEVELTDDLPAGVTFDSATPSQGTLLRVERHGHVLPRHDRRPGRRHGRDQGAPVERGHDHQPGRGRLRRR